jgi:hypothetical protein
MIPEGNNQKIMAVHKFVCKGRRTTTPEGTIEYDMDDEKMRLLFRTAYLHGKNDLPEQEFDVWFEQVVKDRGL